MAMIPSKSPAPVEPVAGEEADELVDGCPFLLHAAANTAKNRSVVNRNASNVWLVLGRNMSNLPFLSIFSSDGVINLRYDHHDLYQVFHK
jgi:hypothetical protein